MGDILTFSKKQPFHEFLDELKDVYDTDLATNLICVYSRDYKEGEECEGFVGKNETYWFGRSSSECLGLMDIMKAQILDFIREANEGD